MAEIQDTDQFLANRDDTTYTVEAQNLMAELLDDDLMLVNRDDVTYKATGKEIKDSLQPNMPPVITSFTVNEETPDTPERYTLQNFDVNVICDEQGAIPMEYSLRAEVTGSLNKTPTTDEITGVGTTNV